MKNIKYELLSKYRNINNFDGKSPLYIVTEDTNEKVSHSILTEESLNHLLEHGKPKPYDSNDFVYFLIKKDGLDHLKKYGWHNSQFLSSLNKVPDKNKTEFMKREIEDIKSNDNYVVVESKYSDWGTIWKSEDGNYHLEPLCLSWYNVSISNKKYYLDELVEHLSVKENLAFITKVNSWPRGQEGLIYTPIKGDEKDIGTVIHDIEHHLEEGDEYPIDETESVSVIYFPDHKNVELIKELVDLSRNSERLDRKNKIFNVQEHVMINILEGKKFLKIPENKEVNKRKFKNN